MGMEGGEKQTTVDENERQPANSLGYNRSVYEEGVCVMMIPNGGKEKNKQRWMRISPASEQLKCMGNQSIHHR